MNPPCGTRARYLRGPCRCRRCRKANSVYERARTLARRGPDWSPPVSARPARAHILRLAKAGVGYKSVAASARTGTATVFQIRAGTLRRIFPDTARRILAVTPACLADGVCVDAAETWRMIDAILAEGYTRMAVAKLLGFSTPKLQYSRTVVTAATEQRVRRLYSKIMV